MAIFQRTRSKYHSDEYITNPTAEDIKRIQFDDDKECINEINKYLRALNPEENPQIRIEIMAKLCHFLYINMWFIDKTENGNYKRIAKDKLQQFAHEDIRFKKCKLYCALFDDEGIQNAQEKNENGNFNIDKYRHKPCIDSKLKTSNFSVAAEEIKRYLAIIESLTSREDKTDVMLHLFMYIYMNIWIVQLHVAFRETVVKKLKELGDKDISGRIKKSELYISLIH